MRNHLTLLLSVAILATPLLSGSAPDCEIPCCGEQENTCPMDSADEVCPAFEASLPAQQQAPAPQQPSGKSGTFPVTAAVSTQLLYAHYNFLTVNHQSPPGITAPLSIPLIV